MYNGRFTFASRRSFGLGLPIFKQKARFFSKRAFSSLDFHDNRQNHRTPFELRPEMIAQCFTNQTVEAI
ncbi:hypothetical protein IAD21_03044 [Abditibacteriota bacterium]|nr:hypothetical protein IAD21_03044 [Abditibacteriota bacterium]